MAMRVWLYARLSNDDDPAQNSLQNQQEICRAFAEKRGWTIAGSSTDDNISGMNFSRRGLDMLTAAVQAKQVDAVLVKDLSRLGRHRTQTALFIDFLREKKARVISVTEGVDTFCEEDDLMIGVRGLMNDYYAKDIGKKIRAGYRQKQKEGLVITPPFGYWKDKNTGQIKVDTEAAVTVQHIYSLYLQECGQKEIARRLNSLGCKTPAQIMTERIGYDSQKPHKTRDGQFLWTYASVKNVLVEEAYTGVLVNHRREYLGGKVRPVNETDWLRHENFYPVIIEKTIWQQVQTRLKQQARPAVNNRIKHRYAGIRHTDHAGDLVKALPCRVVACRAHDVKFCVILHVDDQRMSAGDDKAQKRRLQIGIRQIIGRDMPPDMVNRNERHAEAVRRCFREIHTHQHRADQPRRIRHGNRVDLLPRYGRAGKRLVCQRVNCFNMLARGKLRHNAAVKPVQCDL